MSVQSKCCVCFSQPSSKHEFIYALSVQCAPPILFASRISWTSVASSSKHDPICAMSVGSVKVLCVFLSTLEQARIHLCPVGSMCSSHLVCFTHLVDKRGALEQERTSLYHLGLVKVLCVFLLALEQARSCLCHVRSVCSAHLVCSTHLVDKTWTPRASTTQFLPCRFSQSLL